MKDKKTKRTKKHCSIWLDQLDKDNLATLSEEMRMTMSMVVRFLINEKINQRKNKMECDT
jgi:macrodomain Ter protein organizer (MatP/YcbG family)